VQNIVLKIQQYQGKWLQHCERVDTNRIPKESLKNKQKKGEETWEAQRKDGKTN
jgi:hypothetical protein